MSAVQKLRNWIDIQAARQTAIDELMAKTYPLTKRERRRLSRLIAEKKANEVRS